MRSFVKYVAVLCSGAAFLGLTALLALAADAPPKSGTPDAVKKGPGNGGKSGGQPAPRKKEIPVIKDHPSKGLKIPYLTREGRREMTFTIGVATRMDENHVNLENMQIETFDEEGKHEMDIDLPNSVLDTDTSIITTHHHVTIRRSDFELTGEAMIFNTNTRQGGLSGRVHMIIYDLDSETSTPPGGLNSANASPQTATKKK